VYHTRVHSLQTPSSSSQTEESPPGVEEFLDPTDLNPVGGTTAADGEAGKLLLLLDLIGPECGGWRTVTWTAEILQSLVYV
jgi:hypothetical protein